MGNNLSTVTNTQSGTQETAPEPESKPKNQKCKKLLGCLCPCCVGTDDSDTEDTKRVVSQQNLQNVNNMVVNATGITIHTQYKTTASINQTHILNNLQIKPPLGLM